ncbi:MAG: glycosyltransferase family 39 protein [Chthoniobacterales bacterium]
MFRKEIHWRLAVIGILLLAVVLRLWALDSKPAHFDEGVNGWFADQIRIHGHFSYNPENFHGPWYFYLVHASQTLFGRNLWALRLPAILGSLLGVFLLLKFNRHVGRTAAAFTALGMAVSPAFVFYGRYSIHESWFVAFNILTLLSLFDLWAYGQRQGL